MDQAGGPRFLSKQGHFDRVHIRHAQGRKDDYNASLFLKMPPRSVWSLALRSVSFTINQPLLEPDVWREKNAAYSVEL